MNNPNDIRGFRDEYRFLSNFYPCKICYNEIMFGSVEAAFQSAKCANRADREKFQGINPAEAKKLGRQVKLRGDWEVVKLAILSELVRLKFMENPELMAMLLNTGEALLIEDNSWHDNFYGNCTCGRCGSIPGDNHLGLVLMTLRDALLNRG